MRAFNQPLISIITPAYNAESYISETIESVIAQDYLNWEMLIVVDAKSTDDTFHIASSYASKEKRIKVIRNSDSITLVKNRNIGIDLASGEFITFLDADDRWRKEKLSYQLKEMINFNQMISFHSFDIIDENGAISGPTRVARKNSSYQDLLTNNTIGCLSVMIRRSFIGHKRMSEVRHEDLYFWLQLLQNGEIALAIPKVLAEYRVHSKSLSENKLRSAFWRWGLYKKLDIPYYKRIYLIFCYAITGVLKRV